MGTGQKMGTSFPKGVKKFVNKYRVKSLTVFTIKMTVFMIIYANLQYYKNGQKVLKNL